MAKQLHKLTDSQWAAISAHFDLKRKRKLDLREVVNALLHIVRTGCQWRYLPETYPKWRAVNYYFETWKKNGIFEKINESLNEQDRKQEGREALPSLMCVDSQSVKLAPRIGANRGLDPHKKVNGRKRQLLVDTGGRVWRVCVHAADIADGKGALPLLDNLDRLHPEVGGRLKKLLGDTAYNGIFSEAAKAKKIDYEKAVRPESKRGFVPIAKRWVVERSIAWTNFFRRIVKDYENTVESAESWVIIANITVILQRIY
jgi:transposase